MSLPTIIDLIIVIVLVLYAIDGYRRGFLLLGLELAGTILAFYFALIFASPVGSVINDYFALPQPLQKPIGFLLLWFTIQTLYVAASNVGYPLIPQALRNALANRILGIPPSLAKGLVMIAIIATLLVVLPIQGRFRTAVFQSRLGKPLVTKTQQIQQYVIRAYSKELTDTLTFLTTTPLVPKLQEKGESLKLHFTTTQVSVDEQSEAEMLRLVNAERAKAGLKTLAIDVKLRSVARAHAKDMFAQGYFSHDAPDGKNPFDRLSEAGVSYLTAGENLALAPTVELAHVGLMNSPKHRDNILYLEFGHAGIGVIDGGIYSKMFVQEFTD